MKFPLNSRTIAFDNIHEKKAILTQSKPKYPEPLWISKIKTNNAEMWFFLLIIAMVASYVSARRWGYQLYQYYRPRIAYTFRTRKLPNIESDDDAAKKKFDLESVIILQ